MVDSVSHVYASMLKITRGFKVKANPAVVFNPKGQTTHSQKHITMCHHGRCHNSAWKNLMQSQFKEINILKCIDGWKTQNGTLFKKLINNEDVRGHTKLTYQSQTYVHPLRNPLKTVTNRLFSWKTWRLQEPL